MDHLDHPIDWSGLAADGLERVRSTRPQVHVLTSTVAQPLSANLLLAVGAEPSMSAAAGQIEAFAERTDALVANLGMLDATRAEAIDRAVRILERRAVPWVLDPVKVERSPERASLANALIDRGPRVVRCNADEIEVLTPRSDAVFAITGSIDHVRWQGHEARFANGHVLMSRVTAMGCAGTTLIAAFLAVGLEPFRATGAALLALGIAGEQAAERATGPGTFAPAFLDALYGLDAETLAREARLA